MKRRTILAILAGLLLLSACSGSGTPTPTPWMASADLPGEIIYLDAWEDGLYLCLILPDRSNLRCQALNDMLAIDFTWTADGSLVAYLLQPVDADLTEVWVVDPLDLTTTRKVLNSTYQYPSAPAITADGRWMVVEAQPLEGGTSDLLGVDLETNSAAPLVAANSPFDESSPNISAVDGRLLFVSDRVEENATTLKIYSANKEGGDLVRLTPAVGVDDFAPSWSPDGKQIAFLRRSGEAADPANGLWVMEADGENPRQIVSIANLTLDSDPPVWSPDGQKLAYTQSEEGGSEEQVNPQIWLVDLAGGQARQLSLPGTSNFIVSWSPDSRALLYTQKNDESYYLFMVRPDGTDRQKFIECTQCAFGAWSPNQ